MLIMMSKRDSGSLMMQLNVVKPLIFSVLMRERTDQALSQLECVHCHCLVVVQLGRALMLELYAVS